MMSGMRNAPPISISSPRETIASRPRASVLRHEQHGGGVVVDDGRVLGAGQFAQQRRARGRRARRAGRSPGRTPARAASRIAATAASIAASASTRAAEIGVQHRAGQVEQRAQIRAIVRIEPGRGLSRDVIGARNLLGPGPAAPAELRRAQREWRQPMQPCRSAPATRKPRLNSARRRRRASRAVAPQRKRQP